jgi:hypothetical protein
MNKRDVKNISKLIVFVTDGARKGFTPTEKWAVPFIHSIAIK